MCEYSVKIGAVTDKGNVKDSNQDSILVQVGAYKSGDFGLFVVCDGLGGLAYGEFASSMAVKKFKNWWEDEVKAIVKNPNDENIISSLKQVVYDANKDIIYYGRKLEERLGTTVSALLLIRDKYYIVHVGDSRVYRIDNSKIEKLTEDHSYVALQVKKGEITELEAKKSKKKNILLQCVGVKDNIEIFTTIGNIKGTEQFIVCSDGFYNSLYEYELLRKIMDRKRSGSITIQEFADGMVKEVKSRKERDNISVILVELGERYRTEKFSV